MNATNYCLPDCTANTVYANTESCACAKPTVGLN